MCQFTTYSGMTYDMPNSLIVTRDNYRVYLMGFPELQKRVECLFNRNQSTTSILIQGLTCDGPNQAEAVREDIFRDRDDQYHMEDLNTQILLMLEDAENLKFDIDFDTPTELKGKCKTERGTALFSMLNDRTLVCELRDELFNDEHFDSAYCQVLETTIKNRLRAIGEYSKTQPV